MPQKRYKPEEIINKLRVAEVELSKGQTTGQICRKLGITQQTYYQSVVNTIVTSRTPQESPELI